MKLFSRGMELPFWFSLGFIVYTYFIYPVLLFLTYSVTQARRDWQYLCGRANRRIRSLGEPELPGISLLIPAYNECARLPGKLANLREMDYPAEKLQIIFVSDGSTDGTNELLQRASGSNQELLILGQRGGKANALNQAYLRARHDILVFSDAATLFAQDALKQLSRHFTNPQVGAVCGALRFRSSTESKQTEGVYWKYESMIRLMEGRLGATMTASGAIYALRRDAYRALAANTVLDDFVIPMNARKAGYRVLYDSEAIATDYAPENVSGEFVRRVRLATGSFRSVMSLSSVPLGPVGWFAFISHKLFRWILPVFLGLLLVSNIALIGHPFYASVCTLQIAFYLLALLGYLFRERMRGARFALLPYFLLAMNAAFLVGLFRSFGNHKEVTWQRVV